jgi:hypothetical protein
METAQKDAVTYFKIWLRFTVLLSDVTRDESKIYGRETSENGRSELRREQKITLRWLLGNRRRRFNSANACCHIVHNPLSSLILSRKVKIKICKSIIFPVALCGCENLSLLLREKHGLRVFENRVLRKIFGPGRQEVTRDWRRLHNEELHNLYCSPGIVRMTAAGKCSTHGKNEKLVQNFSRKT